MTGLKLINDCFRSFIVKSVKSSFMSGKDHEFKRNVVFRVGSQDIFDLELQCSYLTKTVTVVLGKSCWTHSTHS